MRRRSRPGSTSTNTQDDPDGDRDARRTLYRRPVPAAWTVTHPHLDVRARREVQPGRRPSRARLVHRAAACGQARAVVGERRAVELGHRPARLADDRLERQVVPHGDDRVDHHLGRPAGHEHVAPEVAQAALAPAALGQLPVEIEPAVPGHAAKARRGDDRLVERRLANRDRLAVHPRAGAVGGLVGLAQGRDVAHAEHRAAVDPEADEGRPQRDPDHVAVRRVDRVDHPGAGAGAGRPARGRRCGRPPRRERRRRAGPRRAGPRIAASAARSASVTQLPSSFRVGAGMRRKRLSASAPPSAASSFASARSAAQPSVTREPRRGGGRPRRF